MSTHDASEGQDEGKREDDQKKKNGMTCSMCDHEHTKEDGKCDCGCK